MIFSSIVLFPILGWRDPICGVDPDIFAEKHRQGFSTPS